MICDEDLPSRFRGVVRATYTCLEGEHLTRTGTIAVIVGSWLTLFNQGDAIATAGVDTLMAARVGLNYLTPFLVANLGLLARRRGVPDDDRPR